MRDAAPCGVAPTPSAGLLSEPIAALTFQLLEAPSRV